MCMCVRVFTYAHTNIFTLALSPLALFQKVVQGFLIYMIFFYPALCFACAELLSCSDTIEDKSYLLADMQVGGSMLVWVVCEFN